ADKLMEQDDPRGEFIRLGCELALAERKGRKASAELRKRYRELLGAHGATWAARILGPALSRKRGVHRYRFVRGFIEEVEATGGAFLSRGHLWAARTPLRDLTLTNVQATWTRLAQCPSLARIERLGLYDSGIGDARFGDL